jgi:hypothetical protein
MKLSSARLGIALLTLTACGNQQLFNVCRNGPSVPLTVLVQDSVTGAPINTSTLTGYIKDATIQVPLVSGTGNGGKSFLQYLGMRPGTYDVVVNAPTYQEWKRTAVQLALRADSCIILPVNDTARLQKTVTAP